MSNPILEGMEAAYNLEIEVTGERRKVKGGMPSALAWLADNLSLTMMGAAIDAQQTAQANGAGRCHHCRFEGDDGPSEVRAEPGGDCCSGLQ